MLVLIIAALVFWIELPGSAKSVDWDLSQDRHIGQVGWPPNNLLKDTYHIGIGGFRHPRKIQVRLKITDTLVYEAEQVANVYVDKKDRDAPDLVTSIFVVERPASLADARIRFEHLRQALDMPPTDLDVWQRKKLAGGQDDTATARRLPLGETITLGIRQAEYIGSPGRDTHVSIRIQWRRVADRRSLLDD